MITPLKPQGDITYGEFSVLDIETYPSGELIALELLYREATGLVRIIFYSWADLLAYLKKHSRKNKKLRKIYAHNGCGFDWLSLIQDMIDSLDGMKFISDGSGKGVGVTIKLGHKGNINLRDSLRILPDSLANLAKAFSVTLKIDLGGKLPHEVLAENPDLFYEYLHSDCLALLEILEKAEQFINEEIAPIGDLRLTTGSMALAAWRTMLKKPIMTVWNKRVSDLSRRSYIGGRVEVFQPGIYERVTSYDVNSMYPFVMAEYKYPVSYEGYWSRKLEDGGLYEASFIQTNREVPALLFDRQQNSYVYNGSGVYWSWELEKLSSIGGIYSINEGYVFVHWDDIFSRYVNHMFNLRKRAEAGGDKAKVKLAKLFANSLYGKFGQKPNGKEVIILDTKEDLDKYEGRARMISGNLFEVEKEIKVDHEFTAIASAVTSRARIVLFDFMVEAGEQLIYCDTDSIHVISNNRDTLAFHVSNRLGMLKVEKSGAGVYAGKKLYAIKDDSGNEYLSCKGVPKKSVNYDMIYRIMSDHTSIIVDYSTPPTAKEVFSGKQACRWYSRKRTIRQTGFQ